MKIELKKHNHPNVSLLLNRGYKRQGRTNDAGALNEIRRDYLMKGATDVVFTVDSEFDFHIWTVNR